MTGFGERQFPVVVFIFPRNHPEQDPADWVAALHAVVAQLADVVDIRSVIRIGLSRQLHGATALDDKGKVLRPCILWNDGRSTAKCANLMAAGDEFRRRAGNPAMPGFTAPELMWIQRNEPELFARTKKGFVAKDGMFCRI